MRVSRRIVVSVVIISALLGSGVSLFVSSVLGDDNHHTQLAIALAVLVLGIVGAGIIAYYQISLRRALQNQDEAQKLAGLGSWERDLATGKGYWSKNRYRLFGLAPRKTAPSLDEFYSFIHPDDRQRVKQTVSEAIQSAENYETTYRLAHDQHQRVFVSRGTILRGADGTPLTIVGTSQDITEKTRQQKLTEALMIQKDMFISRLGHDLNTPLTPLVTLLPMIRKKVSDEKELRRLELCIQSVAHLRDLVASSMQLARRFQPLRQQLHFETFCLAECVDEVLKNMDELFTSHEIVCKNRIAPAVRLHADRSEVETVFSNLFNNAIKFSQPGSSVFVDAELDNCSVSILVSDQGAGLDADELQHVFDEFYKADSSRHELGSSGLGLSICRQIILNHGGLISATSRGKGFGTTITFTLLAGGAI